MGEQDNGLTGREPGLGQEQSQTDGPVLGGEHRLLHAIEHLQDKNPKIRERAIAVLDEFGNEQVVNRLAVALYDRNEKLRERAGEALGKIGGEQARQILLETVRNESLDVYIRRVAISGLGYCADDPTIDLLFDYIGHENTRFHGRSRGALIQIGEVVVPRLQTTLQSGTPHQRAHALEALTWIYLKRFWNQKDKEWINKHYRTIQELASDEEDVIRRAAIWSASKMNDPYFIKLFAEHLSDEKYKTRSQAITGLAGIGKRFLNDPQRIEEIFNFILEGTTHEESLVRGNFTAVLREIGPDVIPLLIERWHQVPEESQQVISGLARSFGKNLIDQLDDLLDHKLDDEGKRLLVNEFVRLLYQVDGWITLVQREEKWIRNRALRALSRLHHHESYLAVGPLIELAGEVTDSETLCLILKALGNVGQSFRWLSLTTRGDATQVLNTHLIPFLQSYIDNPELRVRVEAVRTLGSLQNPTLVSFLISHMEACQDEQRYYEAAVTAQTLAGFENNNQVTQALLQVFESTNHAFLRRSCLKALKTTGGPQVIPTLVASLGPADHNERVHLIRTLTQIASRLDNEESTQQVITALKNQLDETNPYILTQVIHGLDRLRVPGILAELRPYLNHKNTDVQRAAGYVLSEMGDENAVPDVIAALQHTDRTIINHAISASRRLRLQAAVPHLKELASHEDCEVSRHAILALGEFPQDDVIQVLADLVLDEANYKVAVELALNQIGAQAVPKLTQMLQSAKTSQQTVRGLRALSRIPMTRDSLPENTVSILKKLLHDSNQEIARNAAYILVRAPEAFTISELAEFLNNKDIGIVNYALTALGQRETDEAFSHLENVYLTGKNPLNQIALRFIYENDPARALALILEQTDPVDIQALEQMAALGSLTPGDPRVFPSLVEALKHVSDQVRASAARLLRTGSIEETAPHLRTLLDDPSAFVRAAAIRVLAQQGVLDIDTLLEFIQDPSGDDFVAAVEELSHFDDPRIVPALFAAWDEAEKPNARWGIIAALRRNADPSIVPRLVELLHDESMPTYRMSILRILNEIDCDEARAAVEAWYSGTGS